MKLFFDQNLSYKLCEKLVDLYPEATQARLMRLDDATDADIWEFAKANAFTIVTHDSDFAEMAALYGPPPKVIWLRVGNQPTDFIANLLRTRVQVIQDFHANQIGECLQLF